MNTSAWVTVIYGFILLIGGILGFVMASSKISLIAGIILGISLIICGLQILKKKATAVYISLLFVFLLDAFFTYRFIKSFQFLPAGLMSLISLAVILTIVFAVRREAK